MVCPFAAIAAVALLLLTFSASADEGALHGAYHLVMTMPHRFAGCGAGAR